MTETPTAAEASRIRHAEREHLVREASTMALYVSIVLLAALAAVADDGHTAIPVIPLIWGTTVGLALAHWFAFSLASRLAAGGRREREHIELAAAQILGAIAVAVVVSLPILLLPERSEYRVARFELAVVIGLIAFLVARSNGSGRLRSTLYALGTLVAATTVAAVKNFLAGH